jgi:hypothetical protein
MLVKCVLADLEPFPHSLAPENLPSLSPQQQKVFQAFAQILLGAEKNRNWDVGELMKHVTRQLNILRGHPDVVGLATTKTAWLHIFVPFLVATGEYVYGPFRIELSASGHRVCHWCPRMWRVELGVTSFPSSYLHPYVSSSGLICADEHFLSSVYAMLSFSCFAEAASAIITFLQFHEMNSPYEEPEACCPRVYTKTMSTSLLTASQWEKKRSKLISCLREDDLEV